MPTYAIRLGSKASGLHFGDLIVIRMSSCYGCGRAALFESLEALLPLSARPNPQPQAA